MLFFLITDLFMTMTCPGGSTTLTETDESVNINVQAIYTAIACTFNSIVQNIAKIAKATRTWLELRSELFLGLKSRFLAQKSDFCHMTPILVNSLIVALGETVLVKFPPK